MLDLAYTDGYWSGAADIPAQGAIGLPLGAFEVGEDGGLSFQLVGIPGDPTFRAVLKDGRMTGTFIQGGAFFGFEFARTESAGPARPQQPEPPYPYDATDVAFENGDVTLAGTLTVPEGDGPFPAAVLVSGSGPQDRNEEVFEHKPFLVLADHLTRAGIAVLRYDDRGVGESTGVFGTATSLDFKDDALAAVRFLRTRERVDPGRVGMIGHSEGGLIAPLAAAESEHLAFIVLMAGPGVPGKDILVRQVGLLSKAAGGSDEYVEQVRKEQAKAIDLVLADASEAEVRAQVRKLVAAQAGADPEAAGDEAVEAAVAQLQSPWFRLFLELDPRVALREVMIPVLAINGEKDLQVDPDQSLPEIAKALDEAGNPDVTTREFPGLNHLFQKAETGAVGEYYELEETIHPPVLDAIRDWILERFGQPTGPAGL
jgi:pimeloyl-ACP methyl ester carboxylesterase